MRGMRKTAALALACSAWTSTPVRLQAAQESPGRAATLTDTQMEHFLLDAKVIRIRGAGGGVNNSRRATLSDGRLTHDAHVQAVDTARVFFEARGHSEMNFRDTYRYNVAAYRLARLLELDNVPVSVERRVHGQLSAVTWWIDDVMMDERERLKTKVQDPDVQRSTTYVYRQRVFDELIQNRDRNHGNLLYTSGWKMWMIDHTRAFRLERRLRNPDQLVRIERFLLENLRQLTSGRLAQAAGRSLSGAEIDAVLARRTAIVTMFDAKIAAQGEQAVICAHSRVGHSVGTVF
jgi:hypothetical protein